jgi:hypothetical protein
VHNKSLLICRGIEPEFLRKEAGDWLLIYGTREKPKLEPLLRYRINLLRRPIAQTNPQDHCCWTRLKSTRKTNLVWKIKDTRVGRTQVYCTPARPITCRKFKSLPLLRYRKIPSVGSKNHGLARQC